MESESSCRAPISDWTVTGMAEYIERDYAIREACRELCGCEPNECEFDKTCAIVERYKNWPAADVRENVIRTQADRIRAVSDEELARFIDDVLKYNIVAEPDSDICSECKECDCAPCWLDWLKSPVEEVDNGGDE